MAKATKNRKKDRMHLRNLSELHYICKYIQSMIEKVEKHQKDELELSKKLHEEGAELIRNGETEAGQEKMKQVLELREKNKGIWFTHNVDSTGNYDPNGDYKKIRNSAFLKFLLAAEDNWAKANKESVLGPKQLNSDLRRCGIITSQPGKTCRPRDIFGNYVSENPVKNTTELCVSQLEFFARES